MSNTTQYSIWVSELGGRVRHLQNSIPYRSIADLESEANTCQAELWHLYDYARQHNLEIGQYYFQLSDIDARLRDSRDMIERKKNNVILGEQSWWQRVLNIVVTAIGFVSNLLGLASILPRLPGQDRPRLSS